jgi:hypothetical protein
MTTICLPITPTQERRALKERPDVFVPFHVTYIFRAQLCSLLTRINLFHEIVEGCGSIDTICKFRGRSYNTSLVRRLETGRLLMMRMGRKGCEFRDKAYVLPDWL